MSGFISRLLFPEACPICSRLDRSEEVQQMGCCADCYHTYIYPSDRAMVTLPEFAPSLSQVVCCSFYSGKMQDAMQQFKFNGATYIGKYFGKIMYSVLKDTGCLENTDIITAVPISDKRFKERGYNQSLLIAKELSRLSGISHEDVLVRKMQGDTQSSLLLHARQEAVADRFSLKENCEIRGKSILLVDDILTSGSTVDQCGRLLVSAGTSWITATCVTGGRKEFT